jgi:hypothetical protein
MFDSLYYIWRGVQMIYKLVRYSHKINKAHNLIGVGGGYLLARFVCWTTRQIWYWGLTIQSVT